MPSCWRIPAVPASFAPRAALLLLLGPWLCPAWAQLVGPEFQVNSYTTGEQGLPAVAADGSGNFVVVWQSMLQDGSNRGVFGQRFASSGSRLGSEFQVNTHTTGYQMHPAVAADGSGNFLVVWESGYQDGSGPGVFGQRFSSAGGPLGNEFRVNTFTTSAQYWPAVAADGSGNFVVVWQSYAQDGSFNGVFGQRFDSPGAPVGSEFQVNTYTTNQQRFPAVAANDLGDFIVVWESWQQDGSGYGVFGQRFDSAGSTVGSEFQINTYTTDSQRDPAVTADSSGNFVVTWQSKDQDGSVWGVFGQRFDSAGIPAGSELQLSTSTAGNQNAPAVAADGSGNFLVTWMSYGQDGSLWGAFGQRFDSAGIKVRSEFQVNTYTTSQQTYPAVAADGLGNFVVAWRSYGQDGSYVGVFGQRSSNWIFIDGFEAGDVCAWSAAVGSGDLCPP